MAMSRKMVVNQFDANQSEALSPHLNRCTTIASSLRPLMTKNTFAHHQLFIARTAEGPSRICGTRACPHGVGRARVARARTRTARARTVARARASEYGHAPPGHAPQVSTATRRRATRRRTPQPLAPPPSHPAKPACLPAGLPACACLPAGPTHHQHIMDITNTIPTRYQPIINKSLQPLCAPPRAMPLALLFFVQN